MNRPPLRILHLEDSPRDAEIVAENLRTEGIPVEVSHAPGREEFLDLLEREPFDVILCDHNIPGYDGLAALRHARERRPEVPVLMVSGSFGEEEAVRCLQAGAVDYLLKDRLQRLGSAVTRAAAEAEALRQQRQAEQERRDLELRFARFVEQSPDVFWFMGLDPVRILFVSPAVERIWGTPPQAHYADPALWITGIHPDDRERISRTFETFLQGEVPVYSAEYRLLRPDGSERRVFDQGMLIHDEHGMVVGASGIARDVTEQRHLEDQFRQAQKMEAVGRLAGGVAHDFNNVLTAILGFTDLVIEQLGREHPCHAELGEVRRAAESATRLTRQLLAFSRKQILRPVVMDLHKAIQDSSHMLRRLVGEDVELVVRTGSDPALVNADPGQIEQVLMNLVVNARDAMPEGGTLTIETGSAALSAAVAEKIGLGPNRYVTLRVADTGYGMEPDVVRKVFEPFFTTKGPDRGTGLGLSTVWGIVKQSSGSIHVASAPGRGSAFTVYLPEASGRQPEAERPTGPSKSKRARQASETILVVEDQEAVLQLAARALERRGYTVLRAGRPSEALAAADRFGGPVHLVLTDVVLPEMTGPALVEQLSMRRPGLCVVYMSGYTDDTIARFGVLNEGVFLLEKPFTPATLLDAVERVLESCAPGT